MPLYEYQCEACGKRFEVIRKFSDPPLEVCTQCGKGPITRLQSSPAIQFKGTGWYITDYSQKGKPGSESAPSKNEGGDTKGDTKKAGTTATDTSSSTSTPAAPAKPSSES